MAQEKLKNKKSVEGMSKETIKAITESKFDYSTLSACISDIRKNFWNIKTINEFY